MRRELIVKTCSLAGTSDLTVVAPIKKGLVPSLEAITYKTRVRRVLRALHTGRSSAFEYALVRALSDAVERVGQIHSVRIAVLEPEDKVLLAVTFDGAWESYVRVIWQKVARLLDLIFCNTEDYVTGYDHSFEEWGRWLRSAQAETSFLYATPLLTVDDAQYLRMQERLQRRDDAGELAATRVVVPSAEKISRDIIATGKDPTNGNLNPTSIVGGREGFRQGVQSLVGLYRLGDMFPPGTPDGLILHRAARELLPEFFRMLGSADYDESKADAIDRFGEQIAWLEDDQGAAVPEVRMPPVLPVAAPAYNAANVQGGILRPYDDVTHGCLLLIGFDDGAALSRFLERFRPTTDADGSTPTSPIRTIAFTLEGLRVAGLTEEQIAWFPEEFLQGMDKRASVLGDVRTNHPRRWRLPERNWPPSENTEVPGLEDRTPRVQLSAVHIVVQLRVGRSTARSATSTDPCDVLQAEIETLLKDLSGTQALSVQQMQRFRDSNNQSVEHFGFTDGQSQPVLKKGDAGVAYPNQAQLGEILIGYDNEADHAPKDGAGGVDTERNEFLHESTFLVIRKLRQDVAGLEKVVKDLLELERGKQPPTGLNRDHVLAKMMGRWPSGHPDAGKPLIPLNNPNKLNDFNYLVDDAGSRCPMHAHMRRANPRTLPSADEDLQPPPGGRTPRLVRRGIPYGPQYIRDPKNAEDAKTNQQDRGLVFMAYNASIAEQFEVVQRWISGGNSTGSYSGQSDPFLGVPETGRRRYFRFEHEEQTVRMALDGSDDLGEDANPIVQLEWGAYLFSPSMFALQRLQDIAGRQAQAKPLVCWNVDEGEGEIRRLLLIEQQLGGEAAELAWKAALEDPEAAALFTSASIWAAIRARHGGALRTPYGVLVADRSLVDAVLLDPKGRYSVSGYMDRLRKSIGAIYLGLDRDPEDDEYERQSRACNAAIQAITFEQGFNAAHEAATAELDDFIRTAKERAEKYEEERWELNLDARELFDKVLATLCEVWFGLSEADRFLRRGGYSWTWKEGEAPFYPGHFTAPSRYTFQPSPGPTVERLGVQHGRALRAAMRRFIERQGPSIKASVGRAILGPVNAPTPLDLAARTMVGALMGFLPTTDGNLRRVLNEWLRDGTFWTLRESFRTDASHDEAKLLRLKVAFKKAMQLRPVPELIWRTAVASHRIGNSKRHAVDVRPGDTVILALVSATQQELANGKTDVVPIFGGDRGADSPPTHACPGYLAAMGAMTGVLSALLNRPESLRPGPAPLVLTFEGRTNFQVPRKFAPPLRRWLRTEKLSGPTGRLILWGDSWFACPFSDDLADWLNDSAEFGYKAEDKYSKAGQTLKEMASLKATDSGNHFYSYLRQAAAPGSDLQAILLCGGGNDLTQSAGEDKRRRLCSLLTEKSSSQTDPLIKDEVDKFIDAELWDYYNTILKEIASITNGKFPVLIHAYDYPIPDGRPSWHQWLKPCIKEKGWWDPNAPTNFEAGKEIMRRLIKQLNDMVARLPEQFPFVIPVKLTETLEKHSSYAQNYKLLWINELHPTDDGFKLLTGVIDGKLSNS